MKKSYKFPGYWLTTDIVPSEEELIGCELIIDVTDIEAILIDDGAIITDTGEVVEEIV